MKLVVGLGNPGDKYSLTRHNIGFMVGDAIASSSNIDITRSGHKCLEGKGTLAGNQIVLIKPQTFMNLSGEAVMAVASYYDIAIDDIIVVHDDLDLDFGRVKIKSGGGHGGHNGLRSIISQVGSSDFVRVRMGIGRPPQGRDVSGYVLSPFSKEERQELDDFIDRSGRAIEAIVSEGTLKAMNSFN